MNEKSSSARGASATSPTAALSPIVQLLPTGYRDVQPFQRGQGWHSNGKATAKLRRARDESERVVFPVISTSSQVMSTGPSPQQDFAEASQERDESERRAFSPSAAAIPMPPSGPRRPSSGPRAEGNQRSSSSSSFRSSRTQVASPRDGKDPEIVATTTVTAPDEDDEPPPDPAVMERMWQEYNERTKHPTKTVDRETYHRKMQHKYNETKVLRERIARLEMELDDTQRERDEARQESHRHEQRAVLNTKGRSGVDDDPSHPTAPNNATETACDDTAARSGHGENGFATVVSRLSISHKLHQNHHQLSQPTAMGMNTEEISYREKCFKLERTLAAAKESIGQLQARLMAIHETDRETIDVLRAQLELEQQASKLISVQLRETNAAFKSTADELVTTQIQLEKEQIEKQIVVEQIQTETKQLISDHKRKELQSKVKNVVRTLGKEALRQKMEALHTRVLTAEHRMRAAQLEVDRLRTERDQQQLQIDGILASREIKYHGLASRDGGIPGILQRAISLYHGTRTVNDQFLLVQLLYEDTRREFDPVVDPHETNQVGCEDPDDGYCIHILVYEAFTAQDDYLTFHLRDIKRLVPDADKFLARFADRKQDRFLELAELLFAKCCIGYKNGHIVLTERPMNTMDSAAQERHEIPIYRGARYLRLARLAEESASEILVDLVVNEVYNPSVSQLWWLEVHATAIDCGAYDSNNQVADCECRLTIDSQLLKSVISAFASYRPSDCMTPANLGHAVDEQDTFGIHEDLLTPVLDRMEWRRPSSSETDSEDKSLYLVFVDGQQVLCSSRDSSATVPPLSIANQSYEDTEDVIPDNNHEVVDGLPATAVSTAPPTTRVLDHRSIVNVGDSFFCVRIQEVWDGELMLRITMEEPDDAMHRCETSLSETDISAVAEYLYRMALCDTDYSSTIKYGLPVALHDPMCRLLKRHIKPIATTCHGQPLPKEVQVERISIDCLWELVRPREDDMKVQVLTIPEESNAVFRRRQVTQVSVVGGEDDDGVVSLVLDVLRQLLVDNESNVLLRKERIGCRSVLTTGYTVAMAYFGFAAHFHDIVVIDLCPVGSGSSEESGGIKPELVITRRPLPQTLRALGLRTILDH